MNLQDLITQDRLQKLSLTDLQWLDRATKRLEWLKAKEAAETSLTEFIRQAWSQVEPGRDYVHGWHIDAICDHLEAISNGFVKEDGKLFNRLFINIPPGTMKSLCVGVFWPCWEWTQNPSLRYICASHSQDLAIRDNMRARRLIMSDWYQERWGDKVKLTGDQNAKGKFENSQGGFRQAVAAGGITGARGDRVIIDDPHSVEGAGSDAMRQTTIDWFLEAVPTRLNDPISSAIIVIMQRLHEEDVSGVIQTKNIGYDGLILPMQLDWHRPATSIGFVDPREEEGDLLFPARFPLDVVERDKAVMGSYAFAGQMQQNPVPRGGGIIKRAYWQLWDDEAALSNGCEPGKYPVFDYVICSIDTAYTEKEENDPSACQTWGIWHDKNGHSRAMLMHAWSERLEFNALVQRVASTCTKWKVDRLLIEAKASGLSIAQEIRRLHSRDTWSVQTINPGKYDKVARAYQVQPMFEQSMIYSPDKSWSDIVITECESFPKGAHDDNVDAATQALSWFRTVGLLVMDAEAQFDERESITHKSGQNVAPLYPS